MKKKILLTAVSVAAVGCVGLGVLAAPAIKESVQKWIGGTSIEDTLNREVDMGEDFFIANTRPARTTDPDAAKATDGDDATMWTASATEDAVLQIDLDKTQTINNIILKEDGSNVRDYRIDAWNGEEWVQVYSNDLIERYHLAVIDPIKTNALRLVIEDSENNASIKEVVVEHQRPIELDNRFINMAYMTGNSYVHGWDLIEPEKMDTFTDLTLIGNWSFDKDGNFVVIKEVYGPGGFDHAMDPDSDEAVEEMEEWMANVDSYMGENNVNIWLSLTCLKETQNADGTPANGVEGGHTSAFTDDAVREQFVNDLMAYVQKYDFYGVDIDWEYPGTTEEWRAYDLLVRDLSAALHADGRYISTAQSRNTGLSAETFARFDRINIMAYDLYSTMQNHSTFSWCADDILKYFINDLGIDRSKLILGIPWYAVDKNSITNQTDWKAIYGILSADNEEGDITIDEGINTTRQWGFNGPNLIRDKVVYAIKNRIGGVFVWQIKNDFEYDHAYSLARIMNETIEEYTYVKTEG